MAKHASTKLTKRIIDALEADKAGGERTYDAGGPRGFGVHVHPSGRKSYFLDYTSPGTRRRRRMKIADVGDLPLQKARGLARDKLGMVRQGVDPLDEQKLDREAGSLSIWVEQYKDLGRSAGRWGDRSFLEVERHLKRACEMYGNRRLDSVDASMVERWRDTMHTKHGLANANRALSALKACLTEAWRRGLIPTNEAAKVRSISGETPRTRTLSDAEMKALRKAVEKHADPFFRVAMLWLMVTGARRSEVLRATWGDLRLDPPEKAEWTIPKAKNKRPSVRPIPAELVAHIKLLPRTSILVVGGFTDQTFQGRWYKLRAAAGLPNDIHLHDLRRTAGLWATRAGGLQVAQRLLGHADISTTARVYSPLSTDDLREHQDALVAKILPFTKKAEGGRDE